MERMSFDFDGVLTTQQGRELVDQYRGQYEIWIITARQLNFDDAVYEIADELDIPESQVIFTGGRDKWKFIDQFNIAIHWDNNQEQIDKINKNTKHIGKIFKPNNKRGFKRIGNQNDDSNVD